MRYAQSKLCFWNHELHILLHYLVDLAHYAPEPGVGRGGHKGDIPQAEES